MIVSHLELLDFRNYRSASVALEPGVTVLLGPNGQGKTNLVESIHYLATGASHRVAGDQPLVREGAERAVVRARVRHGDRAITIEVEIKRSGSNRLQVNGNPVKSREARRFVDAVIFAPEDLGLVRGDPAGRRRFLDGLLVMRQPRLFGVLSDYDRALRQRNTLLKSARATRLTESALSTLDVWDERLASIGAEIVDARAALVAELAPHVAEAYRTIAGAEHSLDLAMRSSVSGIDPEDDAESIDAPALAGSVPEPGSGAQTRDVFLAALAARRRQELDRGLTLVGPHRDDLRLELRGMPARGFASHGESWSYALALKLAAAQLLRAHAVAGDPVLILDDVFAELDAGRRDRLVSAVGGYEQVVITAAVDEDVPQGLVGRTIRIAAGEVVDG